MPRVREKDVDAIARAFHENYERLAPQHGYETREASAVPWLEVPQANKTLMRSVVRSLLLDSKIEPGPNINRTEYRLPR